MIYRRLYKVATKYFLDSIAEEMLDVISIGDKTFYYTLDEMEFTNKAKALDHQIKYLLEEDDEDIDNIVDVVIHYLDMLKAKYPDTKIFVDTPQGVDCRIGDANIYDDPSGNIVIDCE